MNFKLTRKDFRVDGIFSTLTNADGSIEFPTLEHAYPQPDGTYLPKVPSGTYTCVRGQHQLEHMTAPFTTFEVTNVPGHIRILLHVGNYNSDSDGCILLGINVVDTVDAGRMITESKIAFAKFMSLQDGVDSFTLEVV